MSEPNIFSALILGLIEGLTEFIPVSSTAHVQLASHFLKFESPSNAFTILVQLGAILAILLVYFKRLLDVALTLHSSQRSRWFVTSILVAFLPAVVVGVFAESYINALLERPVIMCYVLIIGGIVLLAVDRLRLKPIYFDAMAYPIPLALKIGICQCVAMIPGTSRSLPRFAKVFRDSHVPLPPITAFVIASSEWLQHNFLWLVITLFCLAIFSIWLVHRPNIRAYTHKWILKLPLLGFTLQLAYVCRSIQTLGMLIKSGLPLAEALVLTRDMMPNLYYWMFFDRLRNHIGEGKSLSTDFESTTLFPPMVTQMMAVGEQTGTLANVSMEVASFHEEELQNRIKVLTTALEPVIIVLMGGFVGFIAVSVILPMFKLSSTVH